MIKSPSAGKKSKIATPSGIVLVAAPTQYAGIGIGQRWIVKRHNCELPVPRISELCGKLT